MSHQIAEEKQSFTTFDSLLVFVLLAIAALVTGSILSKSLSDKKELRAQIRAEELSNQILNYDQKSRIETSLVMAGVAGVSGRSPASVVTKPKVEISPEGRIGMDPWGVPYYYRVLHDTTGKSLVVVFSSGPNRRRETAEEDFELDPSGLFSRLSLQGDDVASTARQN